MRRRSSVERRRLWATIRALCRLADQQREIIVRLRAELEAERLTIVHYHYPPKGPL